MFDQMQEFGLTIVQNLKTIVKFKTRKTKKKLTKRKRKIENRIK